MAAKLIGYFCSPKGLRPSTAKPSSGRRYERAACTWLKQKRFRVLARNFRVSGVEVDCLARDPRGWLWLVEVRGRASAQWRPVETLSGRKILRLEYAAQCLCQRMRESVHLALLEVYGAAELTFRWIILD
ncbi:MAG: YraN family protein [Bdellovibrionales bacterium]|nr:YraN family protein [Bdellovibrionales bacterium]